MRLLCSSINKNRRRNIDTTMFQLTLFHSSVKIYLFAILIILGAITFHHLVSTQKDVTATNSGVFTINELSKYNGNYDEKLYLAVIGTIFDVTKGRHYYTSEGSYHYFVGKDGSRAFITGNFKDESSEKDHVLDLTCTNLLDLVHWRKTFKQKYVYVGVLSGRYYDDNGQETDYMRALKEKIKLCKIEKEEIKRHEQLFPPCNVAWNENDGTQVWCTTTSGGVTRSWEGVPRQLYTPGLDKPQCVCVKLDNVNNSLLKEYIGCPSLSSRCLVLNSL